MELIGNLLYGFGVALTPLNLLMAALGVVLGTAIGAMPGLGSVNGVAILIPITFAVPPTTGIIFLAAIYYGAMYGGAISSITLNIPGASTAVATTFDGYPLAKKGRASQALVAAAVSSFIGGTVSVILFTLFAPPLAEFALKFGPAETFTLMLLAFATFAGLGGGNALKTIIATLLGLMFSTVGLDIVSGRPRMIFGDIAGFYHGINFLVLAIGLYGVGEILSTAEERLVTGERVQAKVRLRDILSTIKEMVTFKRAFGIGSLLGFFVGMLPAAGATPASFMSYSVVKRFSRNPEMFGTGTIEGVIAPETANNAASTGAMLPMLTLGIPGSPTTAVMLGALVIWGLLPGPMLFIEHREFVWGLIGSLYVANVMAVLINLFAIPVFTMILWLPFTILAPLVIVVCAVGGYAPTFSVFDMVLVFVFGLAGYVFRKLDYPLAPMVLALVLGNGTEVSLRQSLIMSHGSIGIFFGFEGGAFTHPIAAALMYTSLILYTLPVVGAAIRYFRRRPELAKA